MRLDDDLAAVEVPKVRLARKRDIAAAIALGIAVVLSLYIVTVAVSDRVELPRIIRPVMPTPTQVRPDTPSPSPSRASTPGAGRPGRDGRDGQDGAGASPAPIPAPAPTRAAPSPSPTPQRPSPPPSPSPSPTRPPVATVCVPGLPCLPVG